MSSDTIIPDGEYELDMSSLFSSNAISDVFGIRYGFRPDMIDSSFPSLMVKETNSADSYILKTESKLNPKALSGSQISSSGFNQVFFEGKMPPTIQQPTSSHSISNILQHGAPVPSTSPSISGSTTPSSLISQNATTNHSEYIMIYNDVTKKFKVEKFQGVIKMSKSREPYKVNQRITDLQERYSKLHNEESANNTNSSIIDFLLKSSSANLSVNELVSPIKIGKRKLTPLNTPLGTPVLLPTSAFNEHATTATTPILSTAASATTKLKQSSSTSSSLPANSRSIAKSSVTKPKKSKLLKAAERQVSRNKIKAVVPGLVVPRTASAPTTPNIVVSSNGVSKPKMAPKSRVIKTAPLVNDSDIEEIKLSPVQQSEAATSMSDEDLDNFADELEKEWESENNADQDGDVKMNHADDSHGSKALKNGHSTDSKSISKPKSIVEVMQDDRQSPAPTNTADEDDEEEWDLNLSDWEDDDAAVSSSVPPSKENLSNGEVNNEESQFQLIVEDVPSFSSSSTKAKNVPNKVRTPKRESSSSPPSSSGSPTTGMNGGSKKPISMRELAAAGSLLNRNSNNASPKEEPKPQFLKNVSSKVKAKHKANVQPSSPVTIPSPLMALASPKMSIGTPNLENFPSNVNSPKFAASGSTNGLGIGVSGKSNSTKETDTGDDEFDEDEFDRALEGLDDLDDLDEEESEEE
ncbi:hypothetical protein CANARDRAFT_27685 [[Candida] arabinofermentans NRRL YB-2248]|uniref:Uncharacterized protein n=1 Tax=[Candida] arabinofermentans NRRL YB-2248 TaxID=983967 RepID=A0A1E4T3Z8_9ASCO|nr:hypothetical protein CANARDRAFT_27685 [[Candida] arabinofermentans NRRL YB-2248]